MATQTYCTKDQSVSESTLLVEIERLKLALAHANGKKDLLNRLLEQKDGELKH